MTLEYVRATGSMQITLIVRRQAWNAPAKGPPELMDDHPNALPTRLVFPVGV